MSPHDPQPLHEQSAAQLGFGKLSVGFQGRVMHYLAQGPYDATLMAGAKRAAQLAVKRWPADGRYVSLMELRGALYMDAAGLQEFRETVGAFIDRSAVPLATVVLVAPGGEDAPMVSSMVEIWRLSRPVHLFTDGAAAWRQINQILSAARLPEQGAPLSGEAAAE
jgi:hypothetical protein